MKRVMGRTRLADQITRPSLIGGLITTVVCRYPLGPTKPAQINFTQKPLDFRRECFSHSLSLLMSAFSLPIPPANFTVHLHRLTERSATICTIKVQIRIFGT
ncbi:hypothetical protein J6590_083160 [Homalodisca vitripennis]|nr:hypothetical protein J6590_083160 [Homalodisca vitripennis]